MDRKDFLKYLSILPIAGATMKLKDLEKFTDGFEKTDRMPVLFSSHGVPTDMIADIGSTPFFKTLTQISADIRSKHKINAVLIISAHWNTNGTFINISKQPETVYDFYGFPDEFYKMKYPAPGQPELAQEIIQLAPDIIKPTTEWGYDHGSWPILRQLFPNADVPIVQMSMDYHKPASYHFELAKLLKSLRYKGVLIIGSGNVVHNLRYASKIFSGDYSTYGWDIEFDEWVKKKVEERDFESLIKYNETSLGKLAAPTPDHYVPMLYSLGVVDKDEPIVTTYEDVYAAFSERSFKVG